VLIREYERFTADEDVAKDNYELVYPYVDKLLYASSFPVTVGVMAPFDVCRRCAAAR
jgi:hypothetical protein